MGHLVSNSLSHGSDKRFFTLYFQLFYKYVVVSKFFLKREKSKYISFENVKRFKNFICVYTKINYVSPLLTIFKVKFIGVTWVNNTIYILAVQLYNTTSV